MKNPLSLLYLFIAIWSSPILAAPENVSLTGQLLVAHERIQDPRFRSSVLLLIRHGATGAFALMINHPTRVPLQRIFPDVPGLGNRKMLLHVGGPLSDSSITFLIDNPEEDNFSSTRKIADQVFFSADPQLLVSVLKSTSARIRAYSGYAGWAPGQLERELLRGDWILAEATSRVIFDLPASKIWQELYDTKQSQQWVMLSPPSYRRSVLW